jgi:tRNA-dependent cyclodipeptide synthase
MTVGILGISPFTSYYSIKNMTALFNWSNNYFDTYYVFYMDKASIYNLMARGYTEEHAKKRTTQTDNKMKKNIIKSLVASGISLLDCERRIILLSQISLNDKYQDKFKFYIDMYKNNEPFRTDCINCVTNFLNTKDDIDITLVNLSMNYLFAELPIWLNMASILDIDNVIMVYKNLLPFWEKLDNHYKLMDINQSLHVMDVEKIEL